MHRLWIKMTFNGIEKAIEIAKVRPIIVSATILMRGAMDLVASQFRMGGPKVGCEINQLRKRGEPLVKKNAAKMKNTVVGSSGKTAPITPSSTQSQPRAKCAYLTVVLVKLGIGAHFS